MCSRASTILSALELLYQRETYRSISPSLTWRIMILTAYSPGALPSSLTVVRLYPVSTSLPHLWTGLFGACMSFRSAIFAHDASVAQYIDMIFSNSIFVHRHSCRQYFKYLQRSYFRRSPHVLCLSLHTFCCRGGDWWAVLVNAWPGGKSHWYTSKFSIAIMLISSLWPYPKFICVLAHCGNTL